MNYKVEPEHDIVRVSDGGGDFARPLGVFDGGARSDDDWQKKIFSNTNRVEVLFRTDSTGCREGWRLDWGKNSQ